MKAVALWSGGKDSSFACFKAIKEGCEVVSLINFLEKGGKRSLSHGISKEVIEIQMHSTGLPYIQKEMTRTEYRIQFISLMEQFKRINQIEGIVFGDIYLDAHKEWIESVCSGLDVEPIMPLWGIATEKLAKEFVDSGFRSIVVATRNNVVGSEFLGREFDYKLINELKKAKIDTCGEEGEFHTFVYDGPMFEKPIDFKISEKRFSDGHWFLELG